MLKKGLTICLILGMVLSFGIGSLAGEKITLDFWTSNNEEWENDVIAAFEAETPDITIRKESIIGGTAYTQKLMLAVASGDTPDVFVEYVGRVAPWWFQDVLVPLNDTLTEEDLADFIPSVLELHTIDGNLFGYPCFFDLRTWGGNVTMLEKAGVTDIPEGISWDFDVWLDALDKVAGMEGDYYPLVFFAQGRSCDYLTLMNFQIFGAALYKDGDYTKTTLNSPEGVKALEWMIEIVAKGYAPEGVAGIGCGDGLGMIRRGKVAFGWVPNMNLLKQTLEKGEIDSIPVFYTWETPHVAGAPAVPLYTGGNAIAVFKGDQEEAAIKFVKFYTSQESFEKANASGKVGAAIFPRISIPFPEEMVRAMEIVEKNGLGDLGLNSPYYLEVRDLQYVALQKAFTGQMTAQEALDEFAEKLAALWK